MWCLKPYAPSDGRRLKSVVRLTAPVSHLWRLPFLRGQGCTDISAQDMVHPQKFQE